MLEVVARVGDDQQLLRGQHAGQPERELGSAYAAG
jgi:hypothetical protein